MSYLPAFHLTDGVFVRCRDCAAIIYETDTATHDAWHDEIRAWREAILANVKANLRHWKEDFKEP